MDKEEQQCEWAAFCKKHADIVESRILALQNIMKNIILLDELNYFGDTGVRYSDEFVETGFMRWKDATEKWIHSVETGEPYCMFDYIATLLPQIPFEKAYRYKNIDFANASDSDILLEVFGENVEWKQNPSSVITTLAPEERQTIYKHFEYMFYYVINAKQDLAFDIETSL
jgi:hypothetical protein